VELPEIEPVSLGAYTQVSGGFRQAKCPKVRGATWNTPNGFDAVNAQTEM
jgi:hypothetical protein